MAVVGLGYVGLPLVVEFGKQLKTIGFDISKHKVECCRRGTDPSFELTDEQVQQGVHAVYTDDPAALKEADIVIVAVPTPVDDAHIPDFKPLIGASISVGRNLKKGAIVVYESTVYPGATEEVCIPVLERESGMKWKQDFFVGYSPERINPGDKEHTLTKILKVVSGDTPETLEKVARPLREDHRARRAPGQQHQGGRGRQGDREHPARPEHRPGERAGDHLPPSWASTRSDVLEAAGTKWNFLPFRPGLVGGHCIGVDPYYLTHKAEQLGYHPQVVLAGRRINDGMGTSTSSGNCAATARRFRSPTPGPTPKRPGTNTGWSWCVGTHCPAPTPSWQRSRTVNMRSWPPATCATSWSPAACSST
jgi:UDP-N-acetyl-D-glucosamine/UDP-N-acetyl-D-galactosamine dehydrogenase